MTKEYEKLIDRVSQRIKSDATSRLVKVQYYAPADKITITDVSGAPKSLWPEWLLGVLVFYVEVTASGAGTKYPRVDLEIPNEMVASILFDIHVLQRKPMVPLSKVAKLMTASGDTALGARRELELWGKLVDGYSDAVERLRSCIAGKPEPEEDYRVVLPARKTGFPEDPETVEAAAVSLGMGTRFLPSKRYGWKRKIVR